MAMLRPKVVAPLLNGFRAVVLSGTGNGSQWVNPVDPQVAAAASVPATNDGIKQSDATCSPEDQAPLVSASASDKFSKKVGGKVVSSPSGSSVGFGGLPTLKQSILFESIPGSSFLPDFGQRSNSAGDVIAGPGFLSGRYPLSAPVFDPKFASRLAEKQKNSESSSKFGEVSKQTAATPTSQIVAEQKIAGGKNFVSPHIKQAPYPELGVPTTKKSPLDSNSESSRPSQHLNSVFPPAVQSGASFPLACEQTKVNEKARSIKGGRNAVEPGLQVNLNDSRHHARLERGKELPRPQIGQRRSIQHKELVSSLSSALKVFESCKHGDMNSDKKPISALGAGKPKNDGLSNLLQPWAGKVNQFDACDILKQLYDPQLAMSFFLWVQEQPSFKHDAYVYTTMIGIMGKARDTAAVEWILGEMKRNGCHPTVVTYNRLIHIYGKANNLQQALKVKSKMEEDGVESDYVTHSTLLNLYSNAGLHSKAIESYEEMKRKGFKPDHIVYTILINSYKRQGELTKASEAFSEMLNSGLPVSLVTWSTMIGLYGQAGRLHDALRTLRAMSMRGVKPEFSSYSSLIGMSAKRGLVAEAEDLFESMLRDGYRPDSVTWSSMAELWADQNQSIKVSQWFHRMLSAGVYPTPDCLKTLAAVFLRVQMYADARLVFHCMSQKGLQPPLQAYTTLLALSSSCIDDTGFRFLYDLMEVCGHPAHQFVRLAMSGEPETSFLRQNVGYLFDCMSHETAEDKTAFSDALVSFLAKNGLQRSAAQVLQEARARNLTSMNPGVGAENAWCLNLHSVPGSCSEVVAASELSRLRESALNEGVFPSTSDVMIGCESVGGYRNGFSVSMAGVEAMLREMKFPLIVNEGVMTAGGQEVRKWLKTEEVGRRLQLT